MTDDAPTRWWWLAFANLGKQGHEQYAGAAIVPGDTADEAIAYAQRHGLRPAFEGPAGAFGLAVFEMPEEPAEDLRGRYLNREETAAIGAVPMSVAGMVATPIADRESN